MPFNTFSFTGTVDPENPNHLSGTHTEVLGAGMTTETITWDLQPS
jgi:hypothetical protein